MRQVKITEAAAEDLRQIWEFIAQYNVEAAHKLIKEFGRKFNTLRDHPLIGRSRDDLLINLRSLSHGEYLIFYLPIDDGVEIYHVLHSSRDIESVFRRFFDSL